MAINLLTYAKRSGEQCERQVQPSGRDVLGREPGRATLALGSVAAKCVRGLNDETGEIQGDQADAIRAARKAIEAQVGLH